ncbi:MAG: arginine repressor [Lachnospiraceae bacterium]|nr:arginine repressor [Lachnospiraceae bacterium]
MKKERQNKIIELIKNENIDTQDELANRLKECGFNVTQATVSRDIRELNLVKKIGSDNKAHYLISPNGQQDFGAQYQKVLREGTREVSVATNILVIKTISGMAMAVAAALDNMDLPEVVGSIAGDDTIMCALRSPKDVDQVKKKIEELL